MLLMNRQVVNFGMEAGKEKNKEGEYWQKQILGNEGNAGYGNEKTNVIKACAGTLIFLGVWVGEAVFVDVRNYVFKDDAVGEVE